MKIKYSINTILIVAISTLLMIIGGCTFDLFDKKEFSFPELEIVSIITENDTSYIVGRIIDPGTTNILFTGFCYNLTGNPDLLENQILLNGTLNEFYAVIPELIPDTTYYFKAFAANDLSYAESEVFEYVVPSLLPPSIPCELVDNVILYGGISYDVFSTTINDDSYYNRYEIEISCYSSGGPTVFLKFNQKPVNGIYKTCSLSNLEEDDKNVYITTQKGMTQNYIQSDGNVYIEVIDDETMKVSFCNLYYYESNFCELKGNATIN